MPDKQIQTVEAETFLDKRRKQVYERWRETLKTFPKTPEIYALLEDLADVVRDSGTLSHEDFIAKYGNWTYHDMFEQILLPFLAQAQQDAAGIKSADPKGYLGTTLYSEDLY